MRHVLSRVILPVVDHSSLHDFTFITHVTRLELLLSSGGALIFSQMRCSGWSLLARHSLPPGTGACLGHNRLSNMVLTCPAAISVQPFIT